MRTVYKHFFRNAILVFIAMYGPLVAIAQVNQSQTPGNDSIPADSIKTPQEIFDAKKSKVDSFVQNRIIKGRDTLLPDSSSFSPEEMLKKFRKKTESFFRNQMLYGNDTTEFDAESYSEYEKKDSSELIYPFENEDGSPYTNELESPLHMKQPANVDSEFEYDPVTEGYMFKNKVGELDIRLPQSMTLKEYQNYDFNNALRNYWIQRSAEERQTQRGVDPFSKFLNPQLNVPIVGFDKIFGTSTIDIKPRGTAELIFGVSINKNKDPRLTKREQNHVSFDFDEKIQMGVTGAIGDKMKLGINYNTEASFDFENEQKLAYQGKEDEIIQNIEAGNVTLPLSGTLITGSSSLFGIKTELKFGNLYMTNVFSQQRGQSQSIELKGGAQIQEFEIYADEYEENRHFFLSHYFRDHFEESMSSLPAIRSDITIQKIEVWVTNRTQNYDDARNIIAFMDLAEGDEDVIANKLMAESNYEADKKEDEKYPYNGANTLYQDMKSKEDGIRQFENISQTLEEYVEKDFYIGRDYEKLRGARKLTSSEFKFYPNLGFISLNYALNADEVLAVAYEYSVIGESNTRKVGDISTSVTAPNTLIVKLIKGTTLSPRYKTWDLMMKNIYSMNAYELSRENFQLQIMYKNDETGASTNTLPVKDPGLADLNNITLLNLFNLDNLDKQNEIVEGGDGFFDFIEGYTISSSKGRILFPMLEPFGENLRKRLTKGNEALNSKADPYVFEELYDSTKTRAKEFAEKNKFYLTGEYQSSSGSEIMLNAMNIPEGSVVVTAGGRKLVENTDYTVDYMLGRVQIINPSLMNSNTPIRVSLESNALFAMQTKTMIGTHLDYKISDDFMLGGTMIHLSEKPLTNKVTFGDDAISNTIWGLDGSYSTEAPFLTKLVDKLPFIETKEKSSISITGEFAHLIPGHAKALKKDGVVYVDDFEGTKTNYELKTASAWYLSSIPKTTERAAYHFKESLENDSICGVNRARISWYQILTDLQRSTAGTPASLKGDKNEQSNHFVREVYERDLFPARESPNNYPQTLSVLNLAYYPKEKGPYNFDTKGTEFSAGINQDGKLKEPESRWGGMMREISQKDFEQQNIEYIEFWLMDPFADPDGEGELKPYTIEGGDMYFHLGNVSEDILKDSRKSFENGLPSDDAPENQKIDSTSWGVVPKIEEMAKGFQNLGKQDIGLDGLSDEQEISYFANYIQTLNGMVSAGELNASAGSVLSGDPSSDNYIGYKNDIYNKSSAGILERYKKFNGLEGNSASGQTSNNRQPDNEDIDNDNTVNETESFFEYHINLRREKMVPGENYIVDTIPDKKERRNGKVTSVTWYHFKIPIREYDNKYGSIEDFRSIRFMRMLMTNFPDSVFLRFAEFQLVRGEWRQYGFDISEGGEGINIPEAKRSELEISAVNIEEDGKRERVNYVLPPGVDRVVDPTNPQLRQLNEQAIQMRVENLEDGEAKAAYKNTQLDLRRYKRLKMFIHAEKLRETDDLHDGDLTAFIRLGSDYKYNYYEYEIPLKLTPHRYYANESSADRKIVWPEENELNIAFSLFTDLKLDRNLRQIPSSTLFSIEDGNNLVKVMGNPSLSDVRTIMIGVRNSRKRGNSDDDGRAKSGEIWMNELRLSDFDEKGGWAAHARMTAKLADFGSVTVTGNRSTPGFGSIEQKVDERQKEKIVDYDVASNFELGKMFAKKYQVRIPVYLGISESFITPEYNPVQQDIKLEDALRKATNDSIKNYYKDIAVDYTRRKSFNVTNLNIANPLGIENTEKPRQPRVYNLSNWTASYAFNEIYHRDVNTDFERQTDMSAILAYNFNNKPKNFAPFQKVGFLNKPIFKIIGDMNFNLGPRQIAFRSDMNRVYQELQYRNLDQPDLSIRPSFSKDFNWFRVYDLKYDITNSLKFDFSARNTSRIDEPDGRIKRGEDDFDEKRKEIIDNIKSLGRTTNYMHHLNANWNVPLNKLPLMQWVNLTTNYEGQYLWKYGADIVSKDTETGSIDTVNLGNSINNSGTLSLNSQFRMTKLYDNVKLIKTLREDVKKIGTGQRKTGETKEVSFEAERINFRKDRARTIVHKLGTENVTVQVFDQDGKEITGNVEVISKNKITYTLDEKYRNTKVVIKGQKELRENIFLTIGKLAAGTIFSINNIGITYTENTSTYLPGYTPGASIFGMETVKGKRTPSIPFILGMYDEEIAAKTADNDWLTEEKLTEDFIISKERSLRITASLEPLPGLKVDVLANRSISNKKTEKYLWENGFKASNQMQHGRFNISYNLFKTSFRKLDKNYGSNVYAEFLNNRIIIAKRLAEHRTGYNYQIGLDGASTNTNKRYSMYENGFEYKIVKEDGVIKTEGETRDGEYPSGYSSLSQDVLIPAFLAAYSGADPKKVSLNPFPSFFDVFKSALPAGWRVTYTGLSNIESLKKHFKSVRINHTYSSTYGVDEYSSNPGYGYNNIQADGFSYIRDEIDGRFIPQFDMGGISLKEEFSPLINVDMSWVNSLITKFEMRKFRILTLGFSNNQLTEEHRKEYIVGAGYRFDEVEIIVNNTKFQSDLNVRIDFSLKDDLMILRRIEEDVDQLSSGNRNISIRFNSDYVLNERFVLRFYYDQNIKNPKVSTTYPQTDIKCGVSVKFTLVQ